MDPDDRIRQLEAKVEYLTKTVELIRHPKFIPPPFLELGENCNVDPRAVLMAPTEKFRIVVGDGTKILRGAEWIGPIQVGRGCYFNRDSYIRSHVTIGDDVLVGPFTRFMTDLHELGAESKRGGPVYREPITVGNGCWIDGSVTIVGGVTIGHGCVIAAGAVVVKDVPPNTLVGGVPGRALRDLSLS